MKTHVGSKVMVLSCWGFENKRYKKLWLKLAKINTKRGLKDKVKTNW